MAGKTKISIPVTCGICGHTSKDSSAFSSHLRRVHEIKTDEERLNYLVQYDTGNNYFCATGDGTLKDFKFSILSTLPFEEKTYKLSKDKYEFIKKLAGNFDKFRVLTDYLFLDLGLTKETITEDIVIKNKYQFSATSLEYFIKKLKNYNIPDNLPREYHH